MLLPKHVVQIQPDGQDVLELLGVQFSGSCDKFWAIWFLARFYAAEPSLAFLM